MSFIGWLFLVFLLFFGMLTGLIIWVILIFIVAAVITKFIELLIFLIKINKKKRLCK